jgi:hypothetical protein
MSSFVLLAIMTFVLMGCGIKGDPKPPGVPVEIGRGKPTYRKAMKKVKVDYKNDDDESDEKDKEEEDEDKNGARGEKNDDAE